MSGEQEQPTQEQIDQLVTLVGQLKQAGNKALQARAYKDALKLYTDGIETAIQIRQHVPPELLSQLHSNRAAVHLTEKRFVEAVNDSRKAVLADKSNMKAYYRAAKASMDLGLFQQACEFCRDGLTIDPNHSDLRELQQISTTRLAAYKEAKSLEQRGFSEEDAMTCQSQLKQLSEQHYLMKQKIVSRDFEYARNERTVSVLSEMSAGLPCFKAIGRGFIAEEKCQITEDLKHKNTEIQEELKELRKALSILDGRKGASEKEMTDIMDYFNRRNRTN